MIISEIGIRNFKSFGNSRQSIKLNTQKGELILLVGRNGAGKSTLLSSFDYALYGKCRGSKKKWATLSTLPNRINGSDMDIDIQFNSNGTDVMVRRGMSPNILELWENGVINKRAGKGNIDVKIEEYVGMDVETFKSFMSMNIDSFKNFISLSTEEKQLLLDKLFNLQIINILRDILKDLVKNNKNRMSSLDSEISTLNESIISIQRSMEISKQKSIEREKENTQYEIESLKKEMELRRDDFLKLKEKIQKVKEKEDVLISDMEIEKKQYIIIQQDIKSAQKDIDLYNSGKCPTCKTDFFNEHFSSLKSSLLDKKSELENIKNELEKNISIIREKQQKLTEISKSVNSSFNEINYFLKNTKSQIDKLENKKIDESIKTDVNLSEFEKTICDLENKREISSDNLSLSRDKEMYYKELNRIFSEDGVKKSIISGIIKPINHFISQNIKQMGMRFEVFLDDTFTANITQLGTSIDPESLSTGENKLINICILISYIMLIRTKKFMNILFLDEVFSSVDLDNIQKILELLKTFSNNYNVNIFVVHHALLNEEMFDKILLINKEIFTSIEEVEISNK